MFLILLIYKKSLEEIDRHLAEHRSFLEEGYGKNYFIVSGPMNPRTGGVVLSQLSDRPQLEKLLAQDPFYINEVADYQIIEFSPIKYHRNFAEFIGEKRG